MKNESNFVSSASDFQGSIVVLKGSRFRSLVLIRAAWRQD